MGLESIVCFCCLSTFKTAFQTAVPGEVGPEPGSRVYVNLQAVFYPTTTTSTNLIHLRSVFLQ